MDRIEFIRSRLVALHGPDDEERLNLPEMLRSRAPTDRVWALVMFELLAEIDRLRSVPASASVAGPKPAVLTCARFRADLSAEDFAKALTEALTGNPSRLITAFSSADPYLENEKRRQDAKALSNEVILGLERREAARERSARAAFQRGFGR